MELISIIVPVYNAQNYIQKCIDSIRGQTFQDWELLLIDDGSQDDSLSLCEKLSREDERIHVFHQKENRGVAAARNLGMKEARGEFLTFVDADDWIKPDFLEVLIRLQKRKADMVICGYEKRFSADRDKKIEGNIPKPSGAAAEYTVFCYTKKEYLGKYFLEGNTHCWGVLYAKELLEGLTFPDGLSIGEDLLFLIDAALKAERIMVTDYPGYQYYINTQGAMEKPFAPSYMDQIACWQQAMEKIVVLSPEFKIKLESILLVSVLLVVGKLARLKKDEQKEYAKEQQYCHSLVKQYSSQKEVFSYLPPGYPLKVRFYRYLPQVYMLAYGRWKSH